MTAALLTRPNSAWLPWASALVAVGCPDSITPASTRHISVVDTPNRPHISRRFDTTGSERPSARRRRDFHHSYRPSSPIQPKQSTHTSWKVAAQPQVTSNEEALAGDAAIAPTMPTPAMPAPAIAAPASVCAHSAPGRNTVTVNTKKLPIPSRFASRLTAASGRCTSPTGAKPWPESTPSGKPISAIRLKP